MSTHNPLTAIDEESSLIKGLHHLTLEITAGCNLRCKHCYVSSDQFQFRRDQLVLVDFKKLLKEAAGLGCRSVQFIGGEPTANLCLPELLEYAHRLDYAIIEIYSNLATPFFNSRNLNLITKLGIRIATSFYSLDENVHDSITQSIGSYRRTLMNLKSLISNEIPIRVAIIVMEENENQLIETMDFLKSLGVTSVGTDRVRGIGRGTNISNGSGRDELCGNCWKGSIVVSSSGEVFPCIMAREDRIGTTKNNLAELVSSTQLREFREQVKHSAEKLDIIKDQCGPYQPCHPVKGCPPNPCIPNNCVPYSVSKTLKIFDYFTLH